MTPATLSSSRPAPCSLCGFLIPAQAIMQLDRKKLCGTVTLWGWHTCIRGYFDVGGTLSDANAEAPTSSSSAMVAEQM